MKHTRKPLAVSICVALFAFVGKGSAQTNTLGEFNKHVVEKWSNDYVRVSKYRVKGSPFLLGESFPGNISYNDGSEMKKVNVLYDIYSQKAGMEVGKGMVQPGAAITEFDIELPQKYGGEHLLFKAADAYEPGMEGFMNVLAEGKKAALLKVFRCRLVPDPANMYSTDIKMFEQYAEYYIHLAGKKEVVKVKLREKDLVKALGGEEDLKEYVANEKLDLSKEGDAVKLLNYFNSL